MTTTWKPTWRPADLEPALAKWLAQPHGLAHAQGLIGLTISKAHPDYQRWGFCLDAVGSGRYLEGRPTTLFGEDDAY